MQRNHWHNGGLDGINLGINGDTIPSDIYIRKAGEIDDQ